mgnify:CR=1 FL=1
MKKQLLRKPEKHEAEENIYAGMGLKGNPFPPQPALNVDSPDPRLNGEIYCPELHRDKKERFEELLVPGENRSPNPLVFLMDLASPSGRGIGKSAFLKHRRDDIMQDLGERASDEQAVLFAEHIIPPPTPPCRKFWSFCRLTIQALSKKIIPYATWRLRALSGVLSEEVLDQVGEEEQWENTIGSNAWLKGKGVNVEFELDKAVQRLLRGTGVSEEWATQLARCGASAHAAAGLFEQLTDYNWRRQAASLLFDELVKFFQAAEFSRGLLLVDELEKVVYHQNAQERRSFVDSLRHYLIDGGCTAARNRFYGMLLTIHPGVQELLLPHWKAAGLDRLAPLAQPDAKRCTLYFDPLNRPQATPLVKVYLDYYRLEEEEKGSVEPFTRDALVEALLKSEGVPGRTLSLLHDVIESAARQGKERIDEEFVNSIYKKREPEPPEQRSDSERPPKPQVDLTGE